MWFKELTGFNEHSPQQVRENLLLDNDTLTSQITGESFACGTLSTPSLGELRKATYNTISTGHLSVAEIIEDVQMLHKDANNAGCLFQVASQFNLLEMVSPNVSPEDGIDRYEGDHTQGPACAIAAGAGTIYRNYFAKVNGKQGQYRDSQIDTLLDIGEALGNHQEQLWQMKNGYALASEQGLQLISDKINRSNESERDYLRQHLRVGIQQDTEVTLSSSKHKVSQIYCSALPVAYSQQVIELWKPFASLVLEASYEATLHAAVSNSLCTGNNKVFLTLLGGGAFGNETSWIINAIKRALILFKDINLEVFIVSYGASNHHLKNLVDDFNA